VFAVTIDGNNEAVVLAWALIESENEESWKFFLTELKMYIYLSTSNWISTVNYLLTFIRTIPEINQTDVTLVSDSDKGLVAADSVLDQTHRAYCCQHIADNIQTSFGLATWKLFWKIAYAHSELLFENALAELQELQPAGADYVTALPQNLYATAFFPGARYGQCSSHLVEAANALFLEERTLPVLKMLQGIWEKEMDWKSTRQEKALQLSETQPFTPYCTGKFTESNHYSQQNTIRMQSILLGIGIVTQQRDQHTFHVNLDTATCYCK
jgi:hypothetical protein